MAISGVGSKFYQNNVVTTKSTKSVNSTEKTNSFAGKVTEKISVSTEECHAEMWSAGYQNGSGKSLFNSKAKDNFEECKIEQKKRIEEQRRRQFAAEQAAKKKRRKHYLLLSEKAALKRKFMEQEENERYYKTSTTKKLVSAYERNLMESVERRV